MAEILVDPGEEKKCVVKMLFRQTYNKYLVKVSLRAINSIEYVKWDLEGLFRQKNIFYDPHHDSEKILLFVMLTAFKIKKSSNFPFLETVFLSPVFKATNSSVKSTIRSKGKTKHISFARQYNYVPTALIKPTTENNKTHQQHSGSSTAWYLTSMTLRRDKINKLLPGKMQDLAQELLC